MSTIPTKLLISTVSSSYQQDIQNHPEFLALRALSARIGSDPLLVQGAGGNTSLKNDGVLWIKASGTWLQRARSDNQFVPVAIEPLLNAVDKGLPSAEKSVDFICHALNARGLRPSIETTVHALLPFRVVLHVHCVNTIALAVRRDAEELFNPLLSAFRWSWIPYVRPGLPLAHMIQANRRGDSDVLILGNHGLVVGADTVSAAEKLLQEVVIAVQQPARTPAAPNIQALLERVTDDTDYRLPTNERSHAVACDGLATEYARGGSMYPDHVIFLGDGSVVAQSGETVRQVLDRLQTQGLDSPTSIVFPHCGTLMRSEASPGQEALSQCLSDVCLRIPEDANVNYLSASDTHALLNWEAETYRQKL